jgi:hypothetical protein
MRRQSRRYWLLQRKCASQVPPSYSEVIATKTEGPPGRIITIGTVAACQPHVTLTSVGTPHQPACAPVEKRPVY